MRKRGGYVRWTGGYHNHVMDADNYASEGNERADVSPAKPRAPLPSSRAGRTVSPTGSDAKRHEFGVRSRHVGVTKREASGADCRLPVRGAITGSCPSRLGAPGPTCSDRGLSERVVCGVGLDGEQIHVTDFGRLDWTLWLYWAVEGGWLGTW